MPDQLDLSIKLKADAAGLKAGVNDARQALKELKRAADDLTPPGPSPGQAALPKALGEIKPQAEKAAEGVKLAAHQTLNLSRQLQDVGVQLAGGQSPLLILIQQGPQAVDAVGGISNAVALLRQHLLPIAGLAAASAAALGLYQAVAARSGPSVEAMAAAQERLNRALFSGAALRHAEELRKDEESAKNYRKEIEQLSKELKGLEAELQATTGPTLFGEQNQSVFGGRANQLRTRIAEVTGELEKNRRALEALNASGGVSKDVADANARATEAWNRKLAEGRAALDQSRAALAESAKASENKKRLLDAERQAEEEARTEYERRVQAAKAGGPALTESLESLIQRTTELRVGEAQLEIDRQAAAERETNRKTLSKAQLAEEKRLREEINRLDAARAVEYDKGREDAFKRSRQVLADDLKEARQLYESLRTPAERYADTVRRVERFVAQGNLTQDEANAILQRASPAYQEAEKAAERYAQAVQRAAEHTTDRIVDFGGDALFDGLSGKSEDFWAEFEELGLRAVTQIAAEAVIRPIVAPVVTGVVGGNPWIAGLNGTTALTPPGQTGLGGINLNLGTNLFGGLDRLAAQYLPGLFQTSVAGITSAGTIGAFTSEAALSSSFANSSSLLPFTASEILPIIGAALPGLFSGNYVQAGLGAAGAGIGTLILPGIGTALGGLAGNLLGGLFGKKPTSGPNAGATIGVGDDGRLAVIKSGADNDGNVETAVTLAEGAIKGLDRVLRQLGATVADFDRIGAAGDTGLEVGYHKGKYFVKPHDQEFTAENNSYETAEDAVAAFIVQALKGADLSGLSAEVATALAHTAATDLETLLADIDFAAAFRRQVELMSAGLNPATAQLGQLAAAAEKLGKDTSAQIEDFLDKAGELGLATREELLPAVRSMLDGLLGLAPAEQTLSGVALAMHAFEENARALQPALEAVGLSAADATLKIEKAIAANAEAAGELFTRGLQASLTPAIAQLDQVKAAYEDAQRQARALIESGARTAEQAGQDSLLIQELLSQGIGAALQGLGGDVDGLGRIVAAFGADSSDAGQAIAAAARRMQAAAASASALSVDAPAAFDAQAALSRFIDVSGQLDPSDYVLRRIQRVADDPTIRSVAEFDQYLERIADRRQLDAARFGAARFGGRAGTVSGGIAANGNDALDEARARADDERQERLRADQALADQRAALDEELRVRLLEATGRHNEAQLEQLRQRQQAELEAAKEFGGDVATLQRVQALEMERLIEDLGQVTTRTAEVFDPFLGAWSDFLTVAEPGLHALNPVFNTAAEMAARVARQQAELVRNDNAASAGSGSAGDLAGIAQRLDAVVAELQSLNRTGRDNHQATERARLLSGTAGPYGR